MGTETRRRPSDADLEAARDAVIDEVRGNSTPAIRHLEEIEELREKRPAVISTDWASGWDFGALYDVLVENDDGAYMRLCSTEDRKSLLGQPCDECGEQTLSCYRIQYMDGSGRRHRNLAVCDTCGFVYEW